MPDGFMPNAGDCGEWQPFVEGNKRAVTLSFNAEKNFEWSRIGTYECRKMVDNDEGSSGSDDKTLNYSDLIASLVHRYGAVLQC